MACPGCGDSLDAFGDHAVCCAKGGWWARHFTVQEFILQDCRAAGLPCGREKIVDPTTLQRPADLWFPRWDGLTDLAVDVTIRHPCAPGLFSGDSASAFSSLHKAEAEKQAKYSRACAKQGCEFEPLVLSTWGRGTPKGEALLRKNHKKGRVGHGQPEYLGPKSGRGFPQGPPGRCKVARKGGPRAHHLGQRIASERHTR